MSSSTALAKRSSDTALSMPPPPPPKRIKRPPKVLDEDTYTSALSQIIARDFFPGLLESEAQQDFLDALDAGDDDWIEEAGKRVRQVMTPVPGGRGRRGVAMTPLRSGLGSGQGTPIGWQGETPVRTHHSSETPLHKNQPPQTESRDKPDLSLSLNAFQDKYTSEDNASFGDVLDNLNAKRAEKYAWLWNGNRLPSKQQLAQQKVLAARAHNETSTALVPRPSNDLDARPATIASANLPTNPRNTFMFSPDSIDDTAPHLITSADAAQQRSRAPPRAVNYAATRVPNAVRPADDDDDDSASVAESLPISAIDAAIAGRPHPNLRRSSSSLAGSGAETPRVNGYAYVDADPTSTELDLMREDDGDAGRAAAEKRARRDLDKTALLREMLGGEGDTASGPNPFSIATQSRREALHHRMVEKSLASKRRLGDPGATPRLSSMSGRKAKGELTPAARMLYEKMGRTPARGPGSAVGGTGVGSAGLFDAKSGAEKKNAAFTPTPVRVKRYAET